ncbi:hypothetical protein [Tenacibaculum piscium]|uniref:hypothetical protein n=1 Tax=Tenacibaculum piscium TaxID=1458515 RepID=UPI001F2C80AF|nr:hypothetical protein [Tenacibaculum piscium]
MENLKNNLEKAIMAVIAKFEEKQSKDFEFFVGNDILGTASFGGIEYFNIDDIYFDILTNQPVGRISEWIDSIELHTEILNFPSYRSFCSELNINNTIINCSNDTKDVTENKLYLKDNTPY